MSADEVLVLMASLVVAAVCWYLWSWQSSGLPESPGCPS